MNRYRKGRQFEYGPFGCEPMHKAAGLGTAQALPAAEAPAENGD